MSESLDEVKQRISRKYIGKEGIHGVGLRRSQNAVCLYMKDIPDLDRKNLIEEIEREAVPYNVIVIQDEPPTFT